MVRMITQEMIDSAFNNIEIKFPIDCQNIIDTVKELYNINLSLAQAQTIWENYSDSFGAGWLYISSDKEIIDAIELFIFKGNKHGRG